MGNDRHISKWTSVAAILFGAGTPFSKLLLVATHDEHTPGVTEKKLIAINLNTK